MGLPFRFFLRFLRNLALFLREGWNHSNRRLWDTFALLRSLFSPGRPKKRNDVGRGTESRPTKPSPTTVICASGLPPHLTPIPGGDTPVIDSPPTVSIQVHRATLGPGDYIDEAGENGAGYLGLDEYHLGGSGSLLGSHNPADNHDEPNPINLILRNQEDPTSNSPASRSRSISGSLRPPSRDTGHYNQGTRQWQGSSHYQPSVNSFHSPPGLTGAETAARMYLSTGPPTGFPPSRPPSIAAGSATSHTSHIPTTHPLARRPSSGTRSRRDGSPVPTFSRQSERVTPSSPDLPQPPPNSGTMGSVHRDGAAGSANVPPPSPLEVKLVPMLQIQRYEKHKKVVIGKEVKEHTFRPVTTQFPRESTPENCSPLMHPEGALYWVDDTGSIYTDTDMCDEGQRGYIEEALKEINKLMKESNPPLPPADDWELALELGEDQSGNPICSYYFICHSARCLFWLHDFNVERALEGLRGVTELPHIHLSLQAQYWTHWEMFPHNRVVPEQIHQELLGILVHAGVDCMTSSNSTAAYSEEELNRFLGYVERITIVGGDFGFSACIVGRLMGFFLYTRYINFHGQRGARLTHDQTIYGTHQRRTWLIKILSVFFFYAPELHLRSLESIYTDSVLYQYRWAQFTKRLQNDWTEFILYGTVLLTANVGFLAAPSVDPGDHLNPILAHLASYLSIITSIGSVVIGLLLLRQHKTQPQESAEEADKYLRGRRHDALGFETLAIQYSLPYALLLWSAIAFTTVFCLKSLAFTHQLWVKLPVGITLAVIILLMLWCIWTSIGAGKSLRVFYGSRHLKDWIADLTRRLRDKPHGIEQDAGEP